MSDSRETNIRRDSGLRGEYAGFTTHSLSPIRERAENVREKLASLAPGFMIGWTRIGVSPEETQVTEDAADDSGVEIHTMSASKEPGIILGYHYIDLRLGEGQAYSNSPDSEASESK